MYNLNEIQDYNNIWWNAIRSNCKTNGLNAPELLQTNVQLQDLGKSGQLFLGQTCGWPLTINQSSYNVVGVPKYSCNGCIDDRYRSVIIIRNDLYMDNSISQMKNRTVAINSRTSCSGCLLLAATIGKDIMKSMKVIYTGAHVLSVQAVNDGQADYASIDCVTFALIQKHRPELLVNIKVIGYTLSCPSLPYVTSRTATDDFIHIIQQSIQQTLLTTDTTVIHALSQLYLTDMTITSDTDLFMNRYITCISQLQLLASASIDVYTPKEWFITDWTVIDDAYENISRPIESSNTSSNTDDNWKEDSVQSTLLGLQPMDTVFAQSLIDHILSYTTNTTNTNNTNSSNNSSVNMFSTWKLMEDGIRSIRIIFPNGIQSATEYIQNHHSPNYDTSPSNDTASEEDIYNIVCFLGNRKPVYDCLPNDHEIVSDCWSTDTELCLHLDSNIILGYATAEVEPGGDWGNVVLFKHGKDANDFISDTSNECHRHATKDISPLYYSQVRIHRGKVHIHGSNHINNTTNTPDTNNTVTYHRTLYVKYTNPNIVTTNECPIKYRRIFDWN